MHFSRPLIPCIAAYAAGLWLVHDIYHENIAIAVVIGLCVVLISCVVSALKKDSTPLYLLALFLLGGTVMGVSEYQQVRALDLAKDLAEPQIKIITGKVAAIAELDDTEKARVILTSVTVSSGTKTLTVPGRVQVVLPSTSMDPGMLPATGEVIQFPGKLSAPSTLQNFFGYNRRESLRHEGIYLTAKATPISGSVQVATSDYNVIGQVDRALTSFRKRVSSNLNKTMWNREARLMNAMLFNDMRSLTDEERQVFRDSATFHLFAVSGMHVAILGMALNLVFRAFRMGVRTSWLMVAVVLFVYLWIIGFVPSATRSYLMLVAFTMAYMLGREVDSLSSLVFAVAVVIAYDSAALWQAGFVLSVMGVLAIVVFTPLMKLWFTDVHAHQHQLWHGQLQDRFTDALLATIAVSIVMMPLQIYYFGFWNLMSPIANLLQAGLSTAVLSAGVLVAGLGLVSQSAATVAGHGASSIMQLVYEISSWAAHSHWALFYFHQLPTWILLGSYAIIFGGYHLVYRDTPEFRAKSRARFVTHTFCGIGLLILSNTWASIPSGKLEIWSFDVGQGDSTLLRFPSGHSMLIDGGVGDPDMGRLVVVPQLKALGIRRLDYLVATHDDSDHTGGLAQVIDSMDVGTVLIPKGLEPESIQTKSMLASANARHCLVKEVSEGFRSELGDLLVEVLNPLPQFDKNIPDNDQSIVVKVSYKKFSAMLMGDASTAVEGRIVNENLCSNLSVLKVGHHGSKSSSGDEFLSSARPAFALISCGIDNKFGHPNIEVLRRLTRANCQILRTDTQGAICMETDGNFITFKTSGHDW